MEGLGSLEKRLYDAAATGDIKTLRHLLENDPLLVDRVSFTYPNKTPLHIATTHGHLSFVQEILNLNPQLAEILDFLQTSPLHIASAKGHLDIVNVLISAAPDMCLSRDCEGRNPLHLAAIKGHVDIVKVLISAASDVCLSRDCQGRNPLHLAAIKGQIEVLGELVRMVPLAAGKKVDQGQTALHLCVNHRQSGSLKILVPSLGDIIDARDDNGDTILHLAVRDNQIENTQYLVKNTNIDVKAKNSMGQSARDIAERYTKNSSLSKILDRRSDQSNENWLTDNRDSLMVVAILIATVAFQAGVTPPGGVWQETQDQQGNTVVIPHRAGDAIMAYRNRTAYKGFIYVTTIAFISSLSVILLLISGLPFRRRLFMWILRVAMWLTVTFIAVTYAIALTVVTPLNHRETVGNITGMGVAAWCVLWVIIVGCNTIRLRKRGMTMWRPKIFRDLAEVNNQSVSQVNRV